MKVLPDEFEGRGAVDVLVGQEIVSQDWKRLVNDMHFLWAEHRALSASPRVFFDGFEGDRDIQDIDLTTPLVLSRPTGGDEVVVRCEVGGDNAILDVEAYVGSVIVGSTTIDGSGTNDWTSEILTIDFQDVQDNDEIVPVYFRVTQTGGEVEFFQVSEVGTQDIDPTDIP